MALQQLLQLRLGCCLSSFGRKGWVSAWQWSLYSGDASLASMLACLPNCLYAWCSTSHRQDLEALAGVTAELERLQGAQQEAVAAQHAQQLDAQAAQHAQQLATQRAELEQQATQHAERVEAQRAEFDRRAEALQVEAAQQAQCVSELSRALEEAQQRGRELEQQLEASQQECRRLQQGMAGMNEAMEALGAEAEGLRAARATVAQVSACLLLLLLVQSLGFGSGRAPDPLGGYGSVLWRGWRTSLPRGDLVLDTISAYSFHKGILHTCSKRQAKSYHRWAPHLTVVCIACRS